jgi:hypothetical protein
MKESSFIQKFRREGEIQRLQADLLKVLRSRFGDEAVTELTQAVKAVDDLEPLDRLFDLALSDVSLDDFRSALPTAGAPG